MDLAKVLMIAVFKTRTEYAKWTRCTDAIYIEYGGVKSNGMLGPVENSVSGDLEALYIAKLAWNDLCTQLVKNCKEDGDHVPCIKITRKVIG